MNKYLIEILKNHSSLILPGIGALMVTNRKTGEIKFNPHLTFNDGALASFIATEEKIDKAEAQNKVAKFTSEIKAEVDKGETYDIFQFGTIFKDKNGEMAFTMWKEGEETKDSSVDKTIAAASATIAATATKAKDAAKNVTDKATDKVKDTAEKVADKSKKASKSVIEKAESTAKKAKEKAASAADKTGDVIKKSADKVESTADKAVDTLKDGLTAGAASVNKGVDKTKETVDKAVEKVKEVKNTYIPPADKDKLPEVPKIVAGDSKTTETVVEKTKETVVATAEYEEERKRRGWPWFLLLLLIGIAVAAYFFRDKIKGWLGWDNAPKIENVNNYPDADGDGIPDFADVDLTGGTDADGDGIDDLADLDFTKGADADGDGIDDAFAMAAMMPADEAEADNPLAMADEDEDGIPDFADINSTDGADENNNGVDDRYDAAITMGADTDKDCIDDSIANIYLLNHLKLQLPDADGDEIPDYADVDLTQGEDVNKNGIDDAFEAIEGDKNGDGLNDSILIAMVTNPTSFSVTDEAATDEMMANETTEENDNSNEGNDMTADSNEESTTAVADEPAEIVEPATTQPAATDKFVSSGQYHAIGAAFAEKSNAVGYVSDMTSKGFSAKIIGRFDGLHLVSLKQYDSMDAAKTDLSNMRNTSSSAWIFKH